MRIKQSIIIGVLLVVILLLVGQRTQVSAENNLTLTSTEYVFAREGDTFTTTLSFIHAEHQYYSFYFELFVDPERFSIVGFELPWTFHQEAYIHFDESGKLIVYMMTARQKDQSLNPGIFHIANITLEVIAPMEEESLTIFTVNEMETSLTYYLDGGFPITGTMDDAFNPVHKGRIGDVNNDERISILDALLIQAHLAKLRPFTRLEEALADVDGDGRASVMDVLHMQLFLAGKTVELGATPLTSLIGVESLEVNLGYLFDPLEGVAAFDLEEGDLTDSIVVEGTVMTDIPGMYALTYSVTNARGVKTQIVRFVNVVVMDAQRLVDDTAAQLVDLFEDRFQVVNHLNLPSDLPSGVTIEWSSSDASVIEPKGFVTQPRYDIGAVTVILTATVRYGEATQQAQIEFTVLPLPEGVHFFKNFQAAHSTLFLNDTVWVEGVVVSVFVAGYTLYDGENFMSIYRPNHSTVSLGDRVRVLGRYGVYHTLYQVGNVVTEEVLETGLSTQVPIVHKTVEEIVALDSGANRLINGRTYRTRGQVVIKGTFNNVYIVDGEFELLVYFLSLPESIAALTAFSGQTIELDVVYYSDHSREGVMVVFQGDEADISPYEMTDLDMLNLDIKAAAVEVEYTFGEDVVLPLVGPLGSVFSQWRSSHPDLISDEGTYLAMPDQTTVVTFTGRAVYGGVSGEVTVQVDALALMTMAEAILVPDGRHVMVEGVVQLNIQSNRGFFIYDGTGHMYVRDLNLVPHPYDGPPPFTEGQVVWLVGERDSFSGVPQIKAVKAIETTDNHYDLPENIGEVDIADIGAGVYPAGTVVTLTGIVQVIRGQFTDVRLVDGDAFVQIHHNTGNLLFVDFEGELVTVEVTVFQWDHRHNFVAFFGTSQEINEEE